MEKCSNFIGIIRVLNRFEIMQQYSVKYHQTNLITLVIRMGILNIFEWN